MLVLGIETSCDECSAAVVEDGRRILSNVVATQIYYHKPYDGVVPEIASRKHTEWIVPVVRSALSKAGVQAADLGGVAVTGRPGLLGSLLVGLSYAKGLSYSLGIPLISVDHIKAHLYAPLLEYELDYPYLGLLVSGGHTVICVVEGFDTVEVLGTTIDDACGEAFDKVAKHYQLGYPGGVVIDRLSKEGNPRAYRFPQPSLHKGDHRFDVSYSGLKTAVINQIDQFWDGASEKSPENIAASFQKAAIDMITSRLRKALSDTGIKALAAGGGVAANSYLRSELFRIGEEMGIEPAIPSMPLCTDNGAMIAGLGYHYLQRGDRDGLDAVASARVPVFNRKYL
ncbi:MAG: tRNA (adenosine(37)-N6)-threonylcarbamoyltransferase complex transferase subunit TsaD [Spirochaetales bacterium]|nr:tRNA (adenosine(37)-N6)-threonylcarbamoyltransferase complex transferase subunit TsaD [Spirochaetales bacterium]